MSRRSKDKKAVVSSQGVAAAHAPTQGRSVTEFSPDYSFVKRDLRRIALIGGGIFAVLILLALVIS